MTDIINFFFAIPFPLPHLIIKLSLCKNEALLPLSVSVDRWRLVQDRRCLHRAIGKRALQICLLVVVGTNDLQIDTDIEYRFCAGKK